MFVASLLLTTSALAFEPSTNAVGAEVQWEVMPVYWRYDGADRPDNVDADAAESAIRLSFEAWNAVPGARVRYIEAGLGVAEEDINPVYWVDEWDWDEDILALTSTWSTEKGELVGFAIAINGEDHTWATDGRRDAMDLRNAITHEVGHAIGLGHDPDHGEATMAATASDGETRKRDLHRSDEDGARYLYPGDARQRGIACSGAPAPPTLGFALLGAALVAASRRRRRRAA